MWNLKKIKIQNLFSHFDSEYEFKNNVCTLIVGENHDTGGNNGAGKSTIFEAIALALTNKSLRDLDKEKFINREAEDCFIQLDLENETLRSTLTICRRFWRGSKPVKVQLIENGELNSTITSVNEANKRILELIGISREDLLRYYIIAQDNDYTFFTANDVEKKEVLNRITSANMINPILDKLATDKKTKEVELRKLQNEAAAIYAKIDTLKEQREELIEADNTKEEIEELKRSVVDYESRREQRTISISEVTAKIQKLNSEKGKLVPVDTTELNKKFKKLREKKTSIEEAMDDAEQVLRAATADLDGIITCPDCGSEFIQESKLGYTLQETREVKRQVEEEVASFIDQLDKVNKKINKVKKEIEDGEEIENQISSLEKQIRIQEHTKADLEEDVERLTKKINKFNDEIEKLKKHKKNDAAIKSIADKIVISQKELDVNVDEQVKINADLEMIQYWQYYMGKQGFMTYIANKSISIIEGTVNSFLRKFKSDLSVSINGFKILKDGTVREQIEVFALENGMNASSFMSYSGGERGRINLAGVLAIQHLINMSTEGKGLNAIFLDEQFSQIDSIGLEHMVKILNNMGITIMMITQNVGNQFNADNKLLIVKENGESKIV